jgi:pimeloyl-ACP methyl ester carboxylesterase
MFPVALAAMALAAGCTLLRAKKDLEVLSQTSRIAGTVSGLSDKPACVALYQIEAGTTNRSLAAYQVVYKGATFSFQRKPGEYYVLAFEDANEDGAFDVTERIAWYGAPTPLVLQPAQPVENLTLVLRPPAQARKELPELYAVVKSPRVMRVETKHVGTVASLDDPRFDPATGEFGLWEPVAFSERYGAGLFFLQPYEADKTPVLFVHGVGGTPRNFRALADGLDRSRFQPWVAHYPSGVRLPLLADGFARLLDEARQRYRFQRVVIVAHSMGGLVARGCINRLTAEGKTYVPLFVTLSTPWQGHPGAEVGLRHSPVIIPCWYDVSPGSPYIDALQRTRLPAGTAYYLLFGYRGGSALFAGGGNTDGTLPLASMLDPAMQEAAVKVYGFDDDHAGILSDPAAALRLTRILSEL